MRLSLRLIAAVVALWIAPVAAQAQALWRGAEAGMTPAEVSAVIPGLVADGRDDRGNELYRLSGLELNDTPWYAIFQFKADGLYYVSLHPDDSVPDARVMILHPLVERDLAAKYGPPLSCEARPIAMLRTRRCYWTANSVAIRLSLLEGGGRPVLTVDYQADDVEGSIL